MDDGVGTHFCQEAAKQFQFLVQEHSFAGPTVDINRPIIHLAYLASNLAVDLFWDERESFLGCDVVRLLPGRKVPPVWPEDSSLRRDLNDLLRARLRRGGLAAPPPRQVGHLSEVDKISALLEEYATNLKTYGADIIADSPTTLTS